MNTTEQLHAILNSDQKVSITDLEQRADNGDSGAALQLGVLYSNGKDVTLDAEQGVKWLTAAAEQGEVAAMTLLGWIYAKGMEIEASPKQAVNWFRKAAEAGDADAQCSLADLYYDGTIGIQAPAADIVAWYERAANQQHPKAQYMLGKLLAEGTLLPQNDEAAFQWLTFAILNESEPAQKELAMLTAKIGNEKTEQFRQRMMGQFQVPH